RADDLDGQRVAAAGPGSAGAALPRAHAARGHRALGRFPARDCATCRRRQAMNRASGARSVGAHVRAVRLCLRAELLLECTLLFLAGALLASSAALLSGAPVDARGVVLLCGALCAGAWWLEHPLAPAAVARTLDRRLALGGALATAFELEERRAPLEGLGALLCARVLAALGAPAALRAALPGPGALALP